MIKCNFCKHSTPTGEMNCWKCDYQHNPVDRIDGCEEALKRMKEYNETRSNKKERNENMKVYLLEWDDDTRDRLHRLPGLPLEDKVFKKLSKLREEVEKVSQSYGEELRLGINYYIREFEVIEFQDMENNNELKNYHASGMTFVDGKWMSCGWNIQAKSFLEAVEIAENDEKFRLHSISDNVVYKYK